MFQRGRFVRLESPFEGDGDRGRLDGRRRRTARRAVVGFYRILGRPDPGPDRLRLRGLDPAATYRVAAGRPSTATWSREPTPASARGAELMAAGLALDLERREAAARGDFWARLFVLEAVTAR